MANAERKKDEQPRAERSRARLLVALGVSAALAALSLPGNPFPHLAFVAMVPLIFELRSRGTKACGGAFYAFGVFWWLAAIGWLLPAFLRFSEAPIPLGVAVYFGLIALLALPYLLFGALWGSLPTGRRPPLLAAGLFASVLAVGTLLIPCGPATGLYRSTVLIQIVELGGLPILHLAIGATNFALAQLLSPEASSRGRRSSAMLLFAFPTLLLLYGAIRLSRFTDEAMAGRGFREVAVGMIQPNLGREEDPTSMIPLTEALLREEGRPDLVVWPEVSARYTYTDHTFYRRDTEALLAQMDLPLVVVSSYVYRGAPTPENPHPGYTNTMHLLFPGEGERARYSKRILVPFFEHLPFADEHPFLRELFPGVLRYVPGEDALPIEVDETLRIIPAICYEILFPEHVGDFVESGGNLIVNPTNDRWFARTSGSERHLAVGLLRSVEYRVPWVRVTNSGISVAVDAAGRMMAESRTPLLSEAKQVVHVRVPLVAQDSRFARALFLRGMIILSLVAFALLRFAGAAGTTSPTKRTKGRARGRGPSKGGPSRARPRPPKG